jgi:hypothetical protein
VVRVMNRQVTSLALTFLVFLSACPSPLPSETPAPIDAGEHQDDAGILGCEQAGFQEMADAMPLPLNQIGYVKEAFEVLDSSSTGPEECFQLIVKNAAGGLVPSSVTRHSEGHLISFVPSEPGRYCYSFQSLGQRPVSALFWLYKNVHSACVDVRVRPNAAQACLKLSRACVHTATARGHFACDESLYAFDGGLVGTLKDGGFFIGEGNLLAAFESSRLTNINVTTRLERGTPTDSIFPAQWAIAGSRLAVSDGDSGVTFVIDAGQLVPAESFAVIEDQQVIAISQAGQIMRANQSFVCAVGQPACLHKASGIVSADSEGMQYCDGQYSTSYPIHAVFGMDGGVFETVGTYPFCAGLFSAPGNASFPRRRLLVGNPFGVSKIDATGVVYSAPGALAWYSSDTHLWASSLNETTIWCE